MTCGVYFLHCKIKNRDIYFVKIGLSNNLDRRYNEHTRTYKDKIIERVPNVSKYRNEFTNIVYYTTPTNNYNEAEKIIKLVMKQVDEEFKNVEILPDTKEYYMITKSKWVGINVLRSFISDILETRGLPKMKKYRC